MHYVNRIKLAFALLDYARNTLCNSSIFESAFIILGWEDKQKDDAETFRSIKLVSKPVSLNLTDRPAVNTVSSNTTDPL